MRLGTENAHQIVLQAQEELRCAGVALTARTAAKLVIDAAAFVSFGADNVEAARRDDFVFVDADFRADLIGAPGQPFSSSTPPSSVRMRMSALPP